VKTRAYFIRKPDGTLVMDDGVALPFKDIKEARKVARSVLGIIGYWDWMRSEFVPRGRQ